MWFQMPFKHWHVFYTPITCLLASVFLCSEILENNIGISSEFLRGISLLLSFCVKVILRDFEDPKYTREPRPTVFGYFVVLCRHLQYTIKLEFALLPVVLDNRV